MPLAVFTQLVLTIRRNVVGRRRYWRGQTRGFDGSFHLSG